ncbi:hypothetical protein ABTH68_19740, partial [Acinetobacter baumannii]
HSGAERSGAERSTAAAPPAASAPDSPAPGEGGPIAASAGAHAPTDAAAEGHAKAGFWALTIGSVGVVYGDIGTSPLYAF